MNTNATHGTAMPHSFSISLEEQKNIAIILPAYNEAQTVVDTIHDFHAALPAARIYVIDNNSSDATAQLAQDALRAGNIPGAVLTEKRKGKGNAVRRAFLEVDAEVYLMADADCTYPAAHAAEMVLPVLEGRADMVIGDRRSGGDYSRENTRPLHGFGNMLVQKLVNMVGGTKFDDIMTGYRAMSRTLVRSYPLLVEGFQIETDISLFAGQGRFRCEQVPVRYVDRPEGSESKLNTVQDGLRVLMTIFRIVRLYKPLTFFLTLSAFFAVWGLCLGLPVIWEFMQTSYITKVPSAVLAAALELLAATMLSVGLNLDALAHQRHIDMENTIRKNTVPRY